MSPATPHGEVSPAEEPLGRTLRRAVVLTVVFGAACGVVFMPWDPVTLGGYGRAALMSITYAGMIGIPASLIFRVLAPRMERRSVIVRWCVNVAATLVLSVAGSLAAGLVFIAAGLYGGGEYWPVFLFGVRIAALVALCFCAGALTFDYVLQQKAAELARAQQLGAEARLHALAARIHPHFLFNTLNSISALVATDPARAEAMLARFAGLLRFILDADRRLVPLEQELAIVRDYLEIEQTRFGDRLRWTVDAAPDLPSCEVPPLAVQTLVENSIKHAIAPRRGGGEIRVAVRRDAGSDALALGVWDDGPGFDAAQLAPGHGLDNLRQRLAALYGGAGRLDIERAADGTEVTVHLPATARAA
jgi:two-component sensor histidine kinase